MRIGSWNTEQRLTTLTDKKRGTSDHILNEIEKLDLDVLVLPEAFQERPDKGVDDALRDMDYRWVDARYDDKGREALFDGVMPYMRVLSRLAIQSSEIVRFGDLRNTVVMTVIDPKTGKHVRVFGVHLRDDNEAMRMAGVNDFVDYYNESPDMPTIATGDWNAMHSEDLRARLLGSQAVRYMAKRLPEGNIQTVAERLTDMATGTTLATFEQQTGMRDLDPKHRATTTPKMRGIEWMPSVKMVQIDHIYANNLVDAGEVTVGKDGGADHRPVSVVIKTK